MSNCCVARGGNLRHWGEGSDNSGRKEEEMGGIGVGTLEGEREVASG